MNDARVRRLVFGFALLALFAIAVRLAWLGDDAYITLRTVENQVRGNGLRWNAGDRVQTYTHPLWMLVLLAGRWLSGEVYFTTIAISLALSMLAVALLLRRATTGVAMVATALVLACTRAFVDYTSSGLETPLTYVLLVLFVGAAASSGLATNGGVASAGVANGANGDGASIGDANGDAAPRWSRIVLLAALLATNRMDLALLCAPAVLAAMRGVPFGRLAGRGALAALPFVAWLAFAAIYYGSAFPVTAHAKAFGTGIPARELAVQGLHYVSFALTDDPVLLIAIAAGLAVGFARRGTRALAAGALLYVLYVVKVGGDFMAGRFFLPPFVVATALLATWLSSRPRGAAVAVGALAVGLLALRGVPAWLRSPASDVPPSAAELEAQHGIGDERCVYYRTLGLLAPTREIPVFGALDALVRPGGGRPWILLNGAVGAAGFGAGDRGHVVDPLLCDPLLVRLPARDPTRWRIGHVLRRVPEGYYETLASGENRLVHAGLHGYYDVLRTLVRAPVGSSERIAAAWSMLTGEFDAGLRDFVAGDYRRPPRATIAVGSLPPPLPLGTYWFDEPRLRIVYDGGVAVQWNGAQSARTLRWQALGLCDFRLRFLRGATVVADVTVAQPPPASSTLQALAGLREQAVAVPAAAASFDALWIDAVENALTHTATGPPALGAVTLLP